MPVVTFSTLEVLNTSVISPDNSFTSGLDVFDYTTDSTPIGTIGSAVVAGAESLLSNIAWQQGGSNAILNNDHMDLEVPTATIIAAVPSNALITSVFIEIRISSRLEGLVSVTPNPGAGAPGTVTATFALTTVTLGPGDDTVFFDSGVAGTSFSFDHEYISGPPIDRATLLSDRYRKFFWRPATGQSVDIFPPDPVFDSYIFDQECTPEEQTFTVEYFVTYTTDPAPTQLTVDPPSGPSAGGTPITITGTGFTATPTVTIGGTAATSVVWVSSTVLTCVTPLHVAGAAAIVVTNPDTQACSIPLNFIYDAPVPPEQYSVHLDFGPTAGGNTVTIIGRYFLATPTVTFDGTPATNVVWVNSSHITCKPPAHAAGTVNIVVTNPDGGICTLPLSYEYSDMPPPPPIQLTVRNSLGTSSGTTKGGTSVTIGGSLFQPGCTVTFGGVAATGVVWISSAEIRCVTPAHAAGAATIVVTNPDGGVCVTPLSFLYVTPRDVIVILTSSPPWQTLGQWALHRLDLTPTTQGPAGSAGEDS